MHIDFHGADNGETGLRPAVRDSSLEGPVAPAPSCPPLLDRIPGDSEVPPAERLRALTRVSEVVDKALKGQLARDRAPHYWEPQILTPLHMNMVFDRAGGYQMTEIAERWDYTPAQVANVLGHPDAQTILSTIFALQANHLTDMETRFKAIAPEALNVKVELLRDPAVAPTVRNQVASDLLDRAGYGPRKQVEATHTHRILMPAQAATGLREVLEQSKRVSSLDYSGFLQKPDGEVAASHLQIEGPSAALDSADEASLVPPHPAPQQERVA